MNTRAGETWGSLLRSGALLFSSNYVLVECLALVQNRLGMPAARALLQDQVPLISTLWVDAGDHDAAIQALLAAGRRKLSLVDCVSFQIMRRFGFQEVFTFDPYFEDQGFRMLPSGG